MSAYISEGMRAQRNAEADAMLRRMTDEQLASGLSRGLAKLSLLDVDEADHHEDIRSRIGHPSQHPSRNFSSTMDDHFDLQRRMLNSAISDVRGEIERRTKGTTT